MVCWPVYFLEPDLAVINHLAENRAKAVQLAEAKAQKKLEKAKKEN